MGEPPRQMGRLSSTLDRVLEAEIPLQALYGKTTARGMDQNSTLAAWGWSSPAELFLTSVVPLSVCLSVCLGCRKEATTCSLKSEKRDLYFSVSPFSISFNPVFISISV